MNKLSTGNIFSITNEELTKKITQYWKITSIIEKSYRVIRCSKTGKEFKDINGFQISFIDNAIDNLNSNVKLITTSQIGLKANIDNGIQSGKNKRRINFLKHRISKDQLELKQLSIGTTNSIT
jgi:hypothetical protein